VEVGLGSVAKAENAKKHLDLKCVGDWLANLCVTSQRKAIN